MSDAKTQWLLPPPDEQSVEGELTRALKLHPLAARVLARRGFHTPDAAKAFLSDALKDLPDPFTMKGLPEAAARLARAVRAGEKVTLWGDYDVDGVSSTALLSLFLRGCGAHVETYIPHRLEEGYGLNVAALERIASDGTRLLVTLDCGITSFDEVAFANAKGLEVVVVDHHAVPERMPPALAVLNPLQPGCAYPTKGLCAAGVAFNLCMGVRKLLREANHFGLSPEPNLKESLDLVALATVADVVPLVGANRTFVKHGLKVLEEARRPGIRALKHVAGLAPGPLTAGDIGFRLGPRINAAGRLDDAALGLKLLCAKTEADAGPLAQALDSANNDRQAIERRMLEEAFEDAQVQVDAGAVGLVLARETWHPGVVGIVASRVAERFHRPVVLIGAHGGTWRGSGRSIEGFHLHEALGACAQHLLKYGGHRQAAGVSVAPEAIPAFAKAFDVFAKSKLTAADLVGRCRIDALVTLGELDDEAIDALAVLAPFGMGNPEPVLATRRVVAAPRVLAPKGGSGEGHLKLSLEAAPSLDVIGFRMAGQVALTEGPIDIAYQASFDTFRGVRRVSLKLKDLKAS